MIVPGVSRDGYVATEYGGIGFTEEATRARMVEAVELLRDEVHAWIVKPQVVKSPTLNVWGWHGLGWAFPSAQTLESMRDR